MRNMKQLIISDKVPKELPTDILDFVKDKEKKEKELEDSNRILNEQNRILSALSRDYTTILLCDLKQDTFEVVKGDTFAHNDHAEKKQSGRGSNCYSERIRYYFENILIKESAPQYLEKLLPEYLMKELKETDSIEIYHKTISNGNGFRHFLARAIRLSNEEDHFKIILGFYSVDEIIKKEQEIELQREIIEGLGKVYFSVLAVELDKDRMLSYRESGENGKIISDFCRKCGNRWSKVIPSYAKTMVADNTSGEFERQLGLEALRSQEEDYSMTYEFKSETGINYHQVRVAYVKKKDGTRMAVVGTRNIDSLIKKERMQEEKLKKAYAAAESANKAKTEFLNNMSHDIRTPLNGIIGMLRILEKCGNDGERAKDCLHKIKDSSKLLLSLVNDVLDMAKLESDTVVFNDESINLDEVCREITESLSFQAEEKGLHVVGEHDDYSGIYVWSNAVHLKKILMNLFTNSMKYNKVNGSIYMSMRTIDRSEDHMTCEFKIRDTGIGMSEEFIKNELFIPFVQADNSARSDYSGTGLGMPIVKQLVEKMGGTITVESKLGEGSCFTVVLPFKIDTNARPEEKEDFNADISGVRVLLVEDNELNAEIAEFMLTENGAEVETVKNGLEAVQRFEASEPGTYDVILMDVMMPVMDGLTATRTIRALERQDAKTIPIIAMTANAFREDVEKCMEAGMNAHLAKPLDDKKIKQTISEELRMSNACHE